MATVHLFRSRLANIGPHITSNRPLRVGLWKSVPSVTNAAIIHSFGHVRRQCTVPAAVVRHSLRANCSRRCSDVTAARTKDILYFRSFAWSLTSSLHTSSRREDRDDVRLKLPESFATLLQKFGEQHLCENETELEERGTVMLTQCLQPYFDQHAEQCSITGRKRLPWFRESAKEWAEFAVGKNDAYWQDCVMDDMQYDQLLSNENVKLAEVMGKLLQAPANQGVMQNNTFTVRLLDVERRGDAEFEDFGVSIYPNGTIYIARELVRKLSHDMLAFALARKMAQVHQNHTAERWSIRTFCSLSAHHMADHLSRSLSDNWKGQNSNSKQEARRVLANFVEELKKPGGRFFPGSNQMSLENDKLGLELTTGAGFDHHAAIKVITDSGAMGSLQRDGTSGVMSSLWADVYQVVSDMYNRDQSAQRRQFDPEDAPSRLELTCHWTTALASSEERLGQIIDMYPSVAQPIKKGRVALWSKNFNNLMVDTQGREAFYAFLVSRYESCVANFHKACEEYLQIDDIEKRKARGKDIYERFLKETSPDYVKIDDKGRKAAKKLAQGDMEAMHITRTALAKRLTKKYYPYFLDSDIYLRKRQEERDGKNVGIPALYRI